jgi:hypothetical protein
MPVRPGWLRAVRAAAARTWARLVYRPAGSAQSWELVRGSARWRLCGSRAAWPISCHFRAG